MTLATIDSYPRPISAIDAEQQLLGALINGASLLGLASISADWFYDPIHAALYRAIVARIEAGRPIDRVVMAHEAEDSGLLDEVGGAEYFGQLAALGDHPVAASAIAIRNAWLCRQLIGLGQTMMAMGAAGNSADGLTFAMQRVAALAVAVKL